MRGTRRTRIVDPLFTFPRTPTTNINRNDLIAVWKTIRAGLYGNCANYKSLRFLAAVNYFRYVQRYVTTSRRWTLNVLIAMNYCNSGGAKQWADRASFRRIAERNLQKLAEFRSLPRPPHRSLRSPFHARDSARECEGHSSSFVVSGVQKTLFFIRPLSSPFSFSTFLYSLDPASSNKIHLLQVFRRFVSLPRNAAARKKSPSGLSNDVGRMLLNSPANCASFIIRTFHGTVTK